MDSLLVPFAVICSFGLAGVGLSLLALFQTKSTVRVLEGRAQARQKQLEVAVVTAQESVHGLAAEVREMQQHPPATVLPAMPKPGLNLSKRSQALRMHRHGDPPEHIAAALELPVQEIDLLLKVHRIVISNLVVTARPEAAMSRGNAV